MTKPASSPESALTSSPPVPSSSCPPRRDGNSRVSPRSAKIPTSNGQQCFQLPVPRVWERGGCDLGIFTPVGSNNHTNNLLFASLTEGTMDMGEWEAGRGKEKRDVGEERRKHRGGRVKEKRPTIPKSSQPKSSRAVQSPQNSPTSA